MTKAEIVPGGKENKSELIEDEELKPGQWYWLKLKNHEDETTEHLSFVTHVGSNYAEIVPVGRQKVRVHFDEFWKVCRREANPDPIIEARILEAQGETARLMGEVHELTRRLAVGNEPGLPSGGEGQALARLDASVSAEEHKKALIKAKEDTLPGLFNKIEDSNRTASSWMKAKIIPLKAEAERMKSTIGVIDGRIFNVELYAGLTEQVKLVRKGEPGNAAEKVHLMQRMHYMDEECLVKYQAGGMSFEDIGDFDRWISKKENMDRLLPHQKCVVPFRVRRKDRVIKYQGGSLFDFIKMMLEADVDKSTFLYIRNGDRVYRMSTAVDFGNKLFPDMDERGGGPSSCGSGPTPTTSRTTT